MSGAPLITFPCAYPVKVLGANTRELRACVREIFVAEVGGEHAVAMYERVSRAGNYVSLTATFEATGPEQLERLNQRLRSVGGVRLIL